jgi:hypothetical protein
MTPGMNSVRNCPPPDVKGPSETERACISVGSNARSNCYVTKSTTPVISIGTENVGDVALHAPTEMVGSASAGCPQTSTRTVNETTHNDRLNIGIYSLWPPERWQQLAGNDAGGLT